MNNFLNIRFPENISKICYGGPSFQNEIITSNNGKEKITIKNINPRNKYKVNHKIKTEYEINLLRNFFYIVKGKAYSFRYKDWFDYKIDNEIAIADGVQTKFQIFKKYIFEDYSFSKKITKIVDDSELVKINNNIQQKSEYQINYNEGVIEFNVAPNKNDLINISCEFDIHARLDNNHFTLDQDKDSLMSWENIDIIEIL